MRNAILGDSSPSDEEFMDPIVTNNPNSELADPIATASGSNSFPPSTVWETEHKNRVVWVLKIQPLRNHNRWTALLHPPDYFSYVH